MKNLSYPDITWMELMLNFISDVANLDREVINFDRTCFEIGLIVT